MKENRKFILAITLASYLLFIFVINLVGIVKDSPVRSSNTNNVRNNVFKIYSNMKSVFSVIMRIDTNSGMDPTPNPPLPPKLDDGIETEILD